MRLTSMVLLLSALLLPGFWADASPSPETTTATKAVAQSEATEEGAIFVEGTSVDFLSEIAPAVDFKFEATGCEPIPPGCQDVSGFCGCIDQGLGRFPCRVVYCLGLPWPPCI
ncbi:MAG: hypothetical protein K0U98_00910 [Deltaproteobacteria bacterium]|nr:hypothetical protein [Deltaproteobacteria bacterium]